MKAGESLEIKRRFNMELINIIVYGDGPSGMRLEGGGHFPTYVSKLHKRGRAKSAGVRLGDEVVSINGFPCNMMDLQEAQDLARNTSDIQLEILRFKQVRDTYQEESPTWEGFDTDSSEFHSPFIGVIRNVRQQVRSPFRTANQTSSNISNYVSDDATGIISPIDDRTGKHWRREYRHSHSRSRTSPKLSESSTKRHITRAYIIPVNNEIKPKEKRLFQSHLDPIEINWNSSLKCKENNHTSFDIPTLPFDDSAAIHLQNVPKQTKCFRKTWQPSTPVKNDSTLSIENSIHSPCEEVIIWSSKNFSSQEKHLQKTIPPAKTKTWKPQVQYNESVAFKPSSPIPPPPVEDDDPNASRVVVNEELIGAGLLTRGFVTAAGVPVEMHLEPKKLYSDSSFYEDPCHKYPTIEEQIKMARKVANLLTSNTGRTGKGQKMFLKRQEMSSKWVTHLDPLVEASIKEEKERKQPYEMNVAPIGHLGEGPFDQVSRAKRASELEKMRLKEDKSLHDVVPFDLCAQLAHELHQVKGKGGQLFAKIKAKAEDWVVAENNPKLTSGLRPFNQEPKSQKELLELVPLKSLHNFTPLVKTTDAFPSFLGPNISNPEWHQITSLDDDQPPQNKLKDMINHPKPIMTPWESVMETGNLDKAFERLCLYEELKGPGSTGEYYMRQPGTKQYGYTSSGSSNDPRQLSTNAEVDGRTTNHRSSNGHFKLFSEAHTSEARYKPVHFRPTMI